jgi:glycolate oxidase iron-sulfur subunit
VHEPCTQRNVLRTSDAVYDVLRRIPEARIEALAGNDTCCGAAGTYMLEYPEFAHALRAPKVAAAADADWLVSTNIGCAMHLAAGLREAGHDVALVHPVVLLARQLAAAEREVAPSASAE